MTTPIGDRTITVMGGGAAAPASSFPRSSCWTMRPTGRRWKPTRNLFAVVVLAHLKTLETRQDAGERQAWKVQLVKGLYERGLRAEDVRQLFRFIDWIMELPEVLENLFREEIDRYEEEKRMPYITSVER